MGDHRAHVERLRVTEDAPTQRSSAGADDAFLAAIVASTEEAIIGMTPEGVVRTWNAAAAQLFDTSAERAIGRPIDEVVGARHGVGAHARAAAQGMRMEHFDIVLEDRDGQTCHYAVSISCVQESASGDTLGVCALVRDVTSRRRTEQALRESEARYRSFVQHNADAVFALDVSGCFTEVNPMSEVISGYGERELLGQPFVPLLHPDEAEKVLEHFLLAMEGSTRRFETRIVHRDGSIVDLAVTAVPSILGEEVVGIYGIARDITQSKRAEAERLAYQERLERAVHERTRELEAANRELESFSYSVSHDLRAPLRGIDFFAQVLEEDHAGELDPQGREVLTRIRKESQRMSQLIRDLLELGQATREPLTLAEVDLSLLAVDIVEALRRADPAREVEVEVAEGVRAFADPRMARVLLENLLGNAWKYSAKASRPRVRLHAQASGDGEVVVCVEDNGIGFLPEDAHRLFQPFQRLPNAGAFDGTGVGLATVARIVGRHGGRVWATGRPGEGATFCFTLPRAR